MQAKIPVAKIRSAEEIAKQKESDAEAKQDVFYMGVAVGGTLFIVSFFMVRTLLSVI